MIWVFDDRLETRYNAIRINNDERYEILYMLYKRNKGLIIYQNEKRKGLGIYRGPR